MYDVGMYIRTYVCTSYVRHHNNCEAKVLFLYYFIEEWLVLAQVYGIVCLFDYSITWHIIKWLSESYLTQSNGAWLKVWYDINSSTVHTRPSPNMPKLPPTWMCNGNKSICSVLCVQQIIVFLPKNIYIYQKNTNIFM